MIVHSIGIIYSQTEQYKFRHLTTEDGLPSNYTWSIMKDSHGFMWFTTRAGLCRYDGYDVKVFQYDPKDTTSLSDIFVKSTIVEDTSGYIWVGSFNGLNKFDPNTEKFIRYKNDRGDPHSISGNNLRRIYMDRMGTVWIGTTGRGLNRYNPVSDNFTRYNPSTDHAVWSNTIKGIYEDQSGTFWVGTKSGLYQFNRNTGDFTLIKHLTGEGERINNRFTTITEDARGNIWYCADRIYLYDTTTKTITRFRDFPDSLIGEQNPKYMDILMDTIDKQQTLWIAKDRLYKYDLQTRELSVIGNDPTDPECYIGLGPRAFYKDPSGLIWIATVNGISIMDPEAEIIRAHPEFAEKYQTDAISFLKDNKGHLWVGIRGKGLIHLDENMKLIHQYTNSTEDDGDNPFYGPVMKILEDSYHNIWIQCGKDGIYLLDREKDKFNRCSLLRDGKDIIPDNLFDIYEDSEGTIWVGGPGLFYRHKDTDGPAPFHLDTSHRILQYYTITDIEEDHEGNLWIGSNTGALICKQKGDDGKDRYIQYTHDPDDPYSLSNKYVWSVYVDDTGSVWVGTNHGLNRFLEERNGFEQYLTDVKSGASFIYDITSDGSGYLWLTTEQGLIRFNPSSLEQEPHAENKIREFLPFSKIYVYHFYKDGDGRLYIVSPKNSGKGYFSFYPDSLTDNKLLPQVVITDFLIRNEVAELDSSISAKREIKLEYNENFFSFEFAALDYYNPDQNQYAYKLEGLDENWIYSGSRRFANYTGVPPGSYIFRVKGSNSYGYWNEEGTSIGITIYPPPWKTWWAYALYLLFISSILYIVIRFYLRRQRLLHELELEHVQTEKLEELDRMKSRFFANISHEFRTPLTLILGPIEKMRSYIKDREPTEDLDMMQRNARRLQRLINQLLNLSRIESGKLKLQAREENIISLVNGYVQSFESLAKQKKIDLIFNSDEENIQLFVDKDKIEKILYNLLSNAFKFTGEGGRIEISITPLNPPLRGDLLLADPLSKRSAQSPPFRGDGRGVQIKISDTGRGIPPEKLQHIFDRFYQADDSYTRDEEGTGIGLALTKELVKLHHGEISVKSQTGKGSTFTVTLPVGKEHLKEEEVADTTGISNIEHRTPNIELSEGVESIEKEIGSKSTIDNRKLTTDNSLVLIVENNPDLRSYIRDYLDKSYMVIEAGDGEEGLQEAIKNIPDLILSDVMMPKMDGFELCRKLKTDERTSHIPVILLTARASSESKIEGLETGADDYISKPFDPTELQVRIKNLIRQRQNLREKFITEFWKESKLPALQITASGLNLMDKKFLQKALDVVNLHLSDPEFTVILFGREMAMSRQQMHRKFRALVNQSATEFIRTIRLKLAAQLLSQKSGTVSEIAYDVGFNTLSYFTKSFHQQFGITPSEYADKYSSK